MKISKKLFITLILSIFTIQNSYSMDLNSGGHDDHTVRLSMNVPPLRVEYPNDPLKIEINTGTNALFSCLGLFMSILGSVLLYKGMEKTAHGNCTVPPNSELVREGTSLNKYGLMLIACGLLAIWHKKIYDTVK